MGKRVRQRQHQLQQNETKSVDLNQAISFVIRSCLWVALGAPQQILFVVVFPRRMFCVDVSPPASPLGRPPCLAACSWMSTGPPGIGGHCRRWSPSKGSSKRRLQHRSRVGASLRKNWAPWIQRSMKRLELSMARCQDSVKWRLFLLLLRKK